MTPTNNQDLDRAWRFTSEAEGDWSDDAGDPGGETKWGVPRNNWTDAQLIALTGHPFSALTEEDAKTIYRICYWQTLRCDEFPFPVNLALADFAYNCGVAIASKSLQRASGMTGSDVDGKIGPRSMRWATNAMNRVGPVAFARRIGGRRRLWYIQRVQEQPEMGKFFNVWLQRCIDLAWFAAGEFAAKDKGGAA